jgi:hypothetical protein
LVVDFEVTFVFVFDSETEALGITAPVWSRTVPLTVAVLACGQAASASRIRKSAR